MRNETFGSVIRVLVADDTRIHTQLLAEAMKRDVALAVISSNSDSKGLIAEVDLQNIDVLVLSSNLDGRPAGGFEVLREVLALHPNVRAVMLLDSSKPEEILEAFRAGARGVFSTRESLEMLSKCVRMVHQGQIWADSQQMVLVVQALASSYNLCAVNVQGVNLLSKREMDVVRGVAEGLTNHEIAERLGLSKHTVKNYLFRIFDKLGVSNRVELLFLALSEGGRSQPDRNPGRGVHGVGPSNHTQSVASPEGDRQGGTPRERSQATVRRHLAEPGRNNPARLAPL